MGYNNKLLLEGEKEQILSMYGSKKQPRIIESDVVITDWLSPDENYVIFLDELYDIKNKKLIGNIWENFDNFKFFLKHSFEVANDVPQNIKESVLTSINELVITESTQNISHLKPIVGQIIKEGVFGDIGDWIKEKGVSAVDGVKNFVTKSYEGGKQLVNSISDGDWGKVVDLIKKGIIFVLREIRGAMYHPVGMILDGILVATGIGKTVQWIPWALIVALDVYEVVTQDFEIKDSPLWLRILLIGCDILGLVFAGSAAASAKAGMKVALGGAKTTEEAAAAVAKSGFLKGLLQKIIGALDAVPGKMNEAVTFLSQKFPSGAKFIQKYIGGIGEFIGKISESISAVLKPAKSDLGQIAQTATKETLKTGSLIGGTEFGVKKGIKAYQDWQMKDIFNTLQNTNVKPRFIVGQV
jgi:hypothetical protein